MRTQTTGQLPYSLDRIQLRAIRRQKIQSDYVTILVQPWSQCPSVVPACIVHHHHNFSISSSSAQKSRKKTLETLRFEPLSRHRQQASICRAHCSEDSHLFPCWCMKNNRISIFGRYPHRTTRTVLLEMTFILEPQINLLVFHHATEFFYMSSCSLDHFQR